VARGAGVRGRRGEAKKEVAGVGGEVARPRSLAGDGRKPSRRREKAEQEAQAVVCVHSQLGFVVSPDFGPQ
jgi:hypothetical protein